MKKLLTLLILLLITTTSVFAFTDSFNYLKDNESYNTLLKAIKDSDGLTEVQTYYDIFVEANPKPVDLARMQYHLVRYYVDTDNKGLAQKHLDLGYEITSSLTDTLAHDLAYTEMVSADYYLTGKTGTGMESSSLTKALYKQFPDEVAVFLLEANRTLYSPHIAGGSPKRAIEYFHRLENSGLNLLPVDQFSLDAGLGVGYSKRNKDTEAKAYLLKAVNLFSGDNSLWKILRTDYGITKDNL